MNAAGAQCVGVLLAGGAARRFGGQPKGLARIDGQRIADRALAALVPCTSRVVIVSNDQRAPHWFPGHVIVPDAVAGLGPLAGLATAIRAGGGAPVLVVAWDMPYVTAPLLRALRKRGEAAEASDIPVHGTGATAEPLCAYYRPEALAMANALLDGGERRARALYEALSGAGLAVTMGDRGFERFGNPDRLFMSIDSPQALADQGGDPPAPAEA